MKIYFFAQHVIPFAAQIVYKRRPHMNYDLIIEDLEKWNVDEAFFRDFYHAVENGEPTEELLKREEVLDSDKEMALNNDCIETHLTENRFFEEGRNVVLVKHPRYFPFFTHHHVFFEIIYVLSGHMQEITDDRTVDLYEGDLCLIAPNVSHGLKVFDDSVILNVLIRYSTFMDIFLNTIRDKSQISLFFMGNLYEKEKIRYLLYHTGGDEIIRNYILDMYMEQAHMDAYSDRIICSLLTIFFTQLTRRHGRTVVMPDRAGNQSEYSDEILNYIMNHYDSVTLNSLAEHLHFSVPYCSKLVKADFGVSFSELITQIRLEQGENLLSHTQMSVADISERLGYKNPETFIRAFYRNYKRTPNQYRKSL